MAEAAEHQPYKKPNGSSRRWCTVCGVEWPCLVFKSAILTMIKARGR